MTASSCTSEAAQPRPAFEARLRDVGRRLYHDKHPFHRAMHAGSLSRVQLQAWVANRFYYQASIPRKDALVLAKSACPAFRRAWMRRLADQDGGGGAGGAGNAGLARWLQLAESVGLPLVEVENFTHVLPAVRFAVDAYVNFVAQASLLEAVASSLTELFVRPLHAQRLEVFARSYPWVAPAGLAYFEGRLSQVPTDVAHGLGYVLGEARTRPQQDAAVAALTCKCRILWALLDAVHFATVSPGWPPPDFPALAAAAPPVAGAA